MGKRLIEEAAKCEEEMSSYKAKGDEVDKNIRGVEKLISKAEESLDDTMTANVTAAEKLEEAEQTASHGELEVSALVRKINLLGDEQAKVDERYKETIQKLSEYETSLEENERERKIHEAKSFSIEEKLELMGAQLEEATAIAEEADRKYEEVARKFRIVGATSSEWSTRAKSLRQRSRTPKCRSARTTSSSRRWKTCATRTLRRRTTTITP